MSDLIYSSTCPRYISVYHILKFWNIPFFVIEKFSAGNLAEIWSGDPNFGQFSFFPMQMLFLIATLF